MRYNALEVTGVVNRRCLVEMIIEIRNGFRLLDFSLLNGDTSERVGNEMGLDWNLQYGNATRFGHVVQFPEELLTVLVRTNRSDPLSCVDGHEFVDIGSGLLLRRSRVITCEYGKGGQS